MKIRKLHIKNYRVFDDIEFDFTDRDGKTLDTVVLAGVNGCGKTTVLEVLAALAEQPKPDFEKGTVSIQVEPQSSDGFPTLIKKSPFYVTFDPDALGDINNPFANQKCVYFPVGRELKFGNAVILKHHKDAMKASLMKAIRDEIFKDLNQPPKALVESYLDRVNSGLFGLVLNSRLVDFESEELVFESFNGKRVYFEELSHGEQQLYFRAIYLSQKKFENATLLIDEPEDAFHPDWQQKIARLYQQVGTNNQVFMATHSPHIMASVEPESLFVLHLDKDHKIRAINMGKAGKHSLGVEPNRILQEVMQVKTLRDYGTQLEIDRLCELLNLENFETEDAENLIEKLTNQLGRQDSFIMRTEHQLLVLRRKKAALETAIVA